MVAALRQTRMRHLLSLIRLSCQKCSQFFHSRDAPAPSNSSGFVSKPVAQCLKAVNLNPGELCTFELLLMLGLPSLCPLPPSSLLREKPDPLETTCTSSPLLWSTPPHRSFPRGFISPHATALPRCRGPTDESWLVSPASL